MLSLNTLSLSDAKALADAAEAAAAEHGFTMVITIFDAGANLIYLTRMDGTQLGSIETSQAKGRTALLYKRPSKALEDAVAGGRTVMMKLVGATPIEGGVPLKVGGQIVGSIGCSGGTSAEDGVVAAAAVARLAQMYPG